MAGEVAGLTVTTSDGTARLPVLLACQSYFSEGRSTVSPRRLVQRAAAAGFEAVGLVDWCSLAGAVELHDVAKEAGLSAVVGVTVPVVFPPVGRQPSETFPLVLLAKLREGYETLYELVTLINLQHQDGLPWGAVQELRGQDHLICLTGGRGGFPTVLGERKELALVARHLTTLKGVFPMSLYVQLYHGEAPNERRRLEYLRALARDLELPVVAAPEIRMADREDYPLLDALTCARLGIDVQTTHPERPRNDALSLETPEHWGELLPFPDGTLNSVRIARVCRWALLPERLHSPEPCLPPGMTPQGELEARALRALAEKYNECVTRGSVTLSRAMDRLRFELNTVAELDMAGFFLTAPEGHRCPTWISTSRVPGATTS